MTPTPVTPTPVTPTPVTPPVTLAAAIPITHQSHPFWQGFNWARFLQVLQVAAQIAPVVVAITDAKDPAAIAEAKTLSDLTASIAAGFAPVVAPAAV
jgi:hypothetical protein